MIQNNIVINIIELEQDHAEEFALATNSIVINIENYPTSIGHTYTDGKFYNENNEEIIYIEVQPNILPDIPQEPIPEETLTVEEQINNLTATISEAMDKLEKLKQQIENE